MTGKQIPITDEQKAEIIAVENILKNHGYDDIDIELIKQNIVFEELEGYPDTYNTQEAMHMVLGTAAQCFETALDAVKHMRNSSDEYQRGYKFGQSSAANEGVAERELPGGYFSCCECGYSFLVDHEPRFCPWCGVRFVEVDE